jgi:hypothetical protein
LDRQTPRQLAQKPQTRTVITRSFQTHSITSTTLLNRPEYQPHHPTSPAPLSQPCEAGKEQTMTTTIIVNFTEETLSAARLTAFFVS